MVNSIKRGKFVALVVALLIAVILIAYSWKDNKIEDTYYVSTDKVIPENAVAIEADAYTQNFRAKKPYLDSIELVFSNLTDEDKQIIIRISCSNGIIYQGGIPQKELENDVFYRFPVNLTIVEGEQYTVTVYTDNCVQKPLMYWVPGETVANENIDCAINGVKQDGQFLMLYGYLKETLVFDKMIETIGIILVLFMVVWGILSYEKLCVSSKNIYRKWMKQAENQRKLISGFGEILLGYVLAENSGIEFQASVKVFIYLISILTIVFFNKIEKVFADVVENPAERNQFILGVLFGAFAMVGSRLFIYPFEANVTFLQLITFLMVCIWIAPIMLLFVEWYRKIELCDNTSKGTAVFSVLVLTFIIIPSCLALYAFNPGISDADSVACMVNAHAIKGMQNWHPPFYCLLLKIIISVWDSTYAVVLVQIVFWAYVVLQGMLLVRRRGINQKCLLIMTFLLGIVPANYIFLCTICKDAPYSITLVWLTIIIAKFVFDNKVRVYTCLEFIVATVFTFFIRQNGMVVYVSVFLVLAIVFYRNIKLMAAMIVSVILVLFVRFPLYTYLDIQEMGGGIYIGLGQDILGVYYSGGEVSEETMKIINVLRFNNISEPQRPYNPYFANSSYNVDVGVGPFVKNYLHTFVDNPIKMSRAMICRQDGIWNVFGGENMVLGGRNYTETMDNAQGTLEIWNEYYPERINNKITKKMQLFGLKVYENQLLNILTWRSGIYTLFMVWSFLALKKKSHKKAMLIYIPFAGQIISLFLASGWAVSRYYWPLNLMTVFVLLIVATVKGDKKDEVINI